ncbi:TraR/DksA family transcriptional regulator [Pandoraea apista]|uniref:TraR/DksA family transcriptional regulator n=1 Tax=Pandoraea apista TaxID=93218 RepID=A0ABX9ZW63_9BURK|nr:TraR/DksA family transcriptional regulator [Pandoraea apista]PTE01955.1 conjugal transfer protein TraR [Pandoraea apista]RRJ32897.1 TraR/DksA family transcriptional regulator [Pandoraea apista]RRJ81748.1 TraR/DksA family transcriptional regulator [Pandoraea apista]RSD11134.1 TraR/DksA family transcriptional regulator [Pandoraea apista]RSD24339.1 TraR/DksA family transcriptional regulator [Pandoraea apista]
MPESSSTLSPAFIERQRKRLEAMRQQLLGSEEDAIANEASLQSEHGDEAHEFEDDAQSLAQDEINQNLRNANDSRIGNIERALQKIAEGTYGFSDESGVPIPQARLEVAPEAVLTVDEQSRRDAGR